MSETHNSGGVLASLRRLLATLVETVQVRLELLVTELEEEKLRLIRMLVYGAAAFVLIAAGIGFVAFYLVVLFWDEHRLLAIGLLALVFLGAGGLSLAAAGRAARSKSRLFSASIGELAADRNKLDPQG